MGRGVRSPLLQAVRVPEPLAAAGGKALPSPHPAMLLWPLQAHDKPSPRFGWKNQTRNTDQMSEAGPGSLGAHRVQSCAPNLLPMGLLAISVLVEAPGSPQG